MEDTSKPFFEHLEELRFCLIKCILAVTVGTVVGYTQVDAAIDFLSQSAGQFVFLAPTEAFFSRLKIALALGVVLTIPVSMYQGWKFIVVALTSVEKRSLFWILPVSYLLFVCGLTFGLFLLVPVSIKFLLSYSSPALTPTLSIEYYINFVGMICLVLGLIFQMPLITFFLAKAGLITSDWLSGKRRISILCIYLASAFLTPGPDPVTSILLAIPTYLLFECSILTAKLALKNE